MTIRRHSSRLQPLHRDLLARLLMGAVAYDRIAGYFTSSVLDIAGAAIDAVNGPLRMVCTSQLDRRDVAMAKKAAMAALRREWCVSAPENLDPSLARPRFLRLHDLLVRGRLMVRVLPEDVFGLLHGKAAVVRYVDGRATSFLGSANESADGWTRNHELVWEDDDSTAVEWVQKEFDWLWTHPEAINLAEVKDIVIDIERLADRRALPSMARWREQAQDDPRGAAHLLSAQASVELPVYRRADGLWPHQKQFVELAFRHHLRHGARLVLADQVGLGKTIQLGLAAMLMTLHDEAPVLILAPKTLLMQWQTELTTLLGCPSARWTGSGWIDDTGVEYPASDDQAILRSPRRIALVSHGLITARSPSIDWLLRHRYACVVVDEAHRARRRNLGPGRGDEPPEPNNLYEFLLRISGRTTSMLLGTATPVQLEPIEAWDLLNILAAGSEHPLGSRFSPWRREPAFGLDLVMGNQRMPADSDRWEWVRNPLPPADEGLDFERLRDATNLAPADAVAAVDWTMLSQPDRDRVERMDEFGRDHSPFIRTIVRRTRAYLEGMRDEITGEPFLPKVEVHLIGEGESGSLHLTPYLENAYEAAREFCALLAQRMKSAGFLKTLLLRRLGSTIIAGSSTARRMLGMAPVEADDLDEGEEDDELSTIEPSAFARGLTADERAVLERFVQILDAHRDRDPKVQAVLELIVSGSNENEAPPDARRPWLGLGTMVFSQYYDSALWLVRELSKALPEESFGLYAGGDRSGVMRAGEWQAAERDHLKQAVTSGALRVLIGTDAAAEGLNLQRLGSLINLDLPWNPTRLEQRKGRIQRIGQARSQVFVANLRYRGSVEDQVHRVLGERLRSIHALFGQIPDVLETAWIQAAIGDIESARQTLDRIPPTHPFQDRYMPVAQVEWESCREPLTKASTMKVLLQHW